MKNMLPKLIFATLCYALPVHIMAETISVKVVNDLGILEPVTVSFRQSKEHGQAKTIYTSTKFAVDSTLMEGQLVIEAINKKNAGQISQSISFNDLKHKEIHIVKDQAGNIAIKPVPITPIPPKKQKISGHKMFDFDEDYLVQITDATGKEEISKSKFARNTKGPLTKSLYVRLNQRPEDVEELKRYNSNTVNLSKESPSGREKVLTFTIDMKDPVFTGGFKPEYQLWFERESDTAPIKAKIVDSKNAYRSVREYTDQKV